LLSFSLVSFWFSFHQFCAQPSLQRDSSIYIHILILIHIRIDIHIPSPWAAVRKCQLMNVLSYFSHPSQNQKQTSTWASIENSLQFVANTHTHKHTHAFGFASVLFCEFGRFECLGGWIFGCLNRPITHLERVIRFFGSLLLLLACRTSMLEFHG